MQSLLRTEFKQACLELEVCLCWNKNELTWSSILAHFQPLRNLKVWLKECPAWKNKMETFTMLSNFCPYKGDTAIELRKNYNSTCTCGGTLTRDGLILLAWQFHGNTVQKKKVKGMRIFSSQCLAQVMSRAVWYVVVPGEHKHFFQELLFSLFSLFWQDLIGNSALTSSKPDYLKWLSTSSIVPEFLHEVFLHLYKQIQFSLWHQDKML